jgi:hypothetical protein
MSTGVVILHKHNQILRQKVVKQVIYIYINNLKDKLNHDFLYRMEDLSTKFVRGYQTNI